MSVKKQISERASSFKRHPQDTGSSEFQVAMLTDRIQMLNEHLLQFKKDYASARGLVKLVAERRGHLDYLSRTDHARYTTVIATLGLRK
jgi:small subunit ribosomal protein S15